MTTDVATAHPKNVPADQTNIVVIFGDDLSRCYDLYNEFVNIGYTDAKQDTGKHQVTVVDQPTWNSFQVMHRLNAISSHNVTFVYIGTKTRHVSGIDRHLLDPTPKQLHVFTKTFRPTIRIKQ